MENNVSATIPTNDGFKELLAPNGLKNKLSLSRYKQTILHGNHPTSIQYFYVLMQTVALK